MTVTPTYRRKGKQKTQRLAEGGDFPKVTASRAVHTSLEARSHVPIPWFASVSARERRPLYKATLPSQPKGAGRPGWAWPGPQGSALQGGCPAPVLF